MTMLKGALLSQCGDYRFHLWREWDSSCGSMVFVCLNPSTADAETDDPTVRKCIGFAERHGYGRMEIVNLFCLRATDPKALRVTNLSITGPKNDDAIKLACHNAGKIVLAWGGIHSRWTGRAGYVSRMIWSMRDDIQTWCFGRTKDGQPRHPLMLAYSTPLIEYP